MRKKDEKREFIRRVIERMGNVEKKSGKNRSEKKSEKNTGKN